MERTLDLNPNHQRISVDNTASTQLPLPVLENTVNADSKPEKTMGERGENGLQGLEPKLYISIKRCYIKAFGGEP